MESQHRYPGAQPFRDDEFSRRTFFGRESASLALTDQILANRLVIVYAKSGLGKTSLLNAGIAPRLREAGSLPLFVRVNDTQHGPLFSVFEGVKAEAERQKVEYVAGDTSSLWSFFKTVEFWRGDLLLTPVLVLDQFEELFTLQSLEEREKFLSELGSLVRGTPPTLQQPSDSIANDTPPAIHVVLSLREDFLGVLEEGSDHIPEIMDHRYRVAPLNYEMASKAITGPAALQVGGVATRAFRLEPKLVSAILDYLTRSSSAQRGLASRYVEPFHLQLICQRIEKVAAFKQQSSEQEVVLGIKDIRGEPGLAETLEHFYTSAIQSLKARHLRNAARRLCEEYLISPEGRRLSVDQRELQRQLKLPPETLHQLVESRLLRTDRRSDSTYYELSHDALVAPVLATRRTQALVVGWVAIIGGSVVLLASLFVIGALVLTAISEHRWNAGDFLAYLFMVVAFGGGIGTVGLVWLRSGLRRKRRYRSHAASEIARPLPTLQPLGQRMLGWIMLVAGLAILLSWGILGLLQLTVYGNLFLTHGHLVKWLVWTKGHELLNSWRDMHDRQFLEVSWILIELATIVAFGWLMLRIGARKLWPHRFAAPAKASPVPGLDKPLSLVSATLTALYGSIALVVAVVVLFVLRRCEFIWHGNESLPSAGFINIESVSACRTLVKHGWALGVYSAGLFFLATLSFSVVWLRKGFLEIRTWIRHRHLVPQVREHRRALVVAIPGAILIVALIFLGMHLVRSSGSPPMEPGKQETIAMPAADSRSAAGWAVGGNFNVLHTEDGGATWRPQYSGSVWFCCFSVTFPTRQLGWAVGGEGSIWHTTDGGAEWTPQSSGTDHRLNYVVFLGPRLGWVVGGDGTILHTDDGGETWIAQDSTTRQSLVAVVFVTRQSGWAVGNGGVILHTGDGGTTWTSQASDTHSNLRYAAFGTLQSGWVVGERGTLLRTEDGGNNWIRRDSGTTNDLRAVTLATPTLGWAVGDKGTILHLGENGEQWTEQTVDTSANLSEVVFVSPRSGWVAGEGGAILHTEDGGGTWVSQNSGVTSYLNSAAFVKPYGVMGVQFGAAPSHSQGVLIDKVPRGSPADHAGLKSGDSIIALNGKEVKTGDELVAEVFVLRPGTNTNVEVRYLRDGKSATTIVTLADGSNPEVQDWRP